MKIHITLYILVFAVMQCQLVFSQTDNGSKLYDTQFQDNNSDPYNVPTPNQSYLGTYGAIPVSPYTGKADISIPLYSSTQRGVKLDINLSYDTSGLLINQLPGWTGHNWTLHAGGAITRKLNGRPDEISYIGTNAGRDIFFQTHKDDIYLMTNGHYNTIAEMQNDGVYNKYLSDLDILLNSDSQGVAKYNGYLNYFTIAWQMKEQNYVIAPSDYDLSADEFFFNFLGFSGSFFYGNDRKWKVRSDQNIRVIFDVNDSTNYIESYERTHYFPETFTNNPIVVVRQPKTIKGFTLIDDSGTKYIFGGEKDYIEYSMSLTGKAIINSTESWCANSWMLKEIQDRFGNILYRFRYSRGTEFVQIQNSYSSAKIVRKDYPSQKNQSSKVYSATINAPVYLDSIMIADGTSIIFNHVPMYPENAYQHIYPYFSFNSISNMLRNCYPRLTYQDVDPNAPKYDPFVIEFTIYVTSYENLCYQPIQNMNLEKLKEMRIVAPNAANTNDYNVFAFVYDYNNRIHLSNLVYGHGSNYSNASTYEFEYNGFDSIPSDYLTKQFDLWGYYNGINYDATGAWEPTDSYLSRIANSGLIPGVPNFELSIKGMLKKITYPTGGYSSIEYEQHKCSRYMSDTKQQAVELPSDIPVGGLRVKSISHYDGGVLKGKKDYVYKRYGSTRSSGELYTMPKYYYAWHDNEYNDTMFIYNSIIPLSNSFSPSIGYSEVSEVDADGSKTIYTYTNFSDEKDQMFVNSRFGSLITPYDEFCSRKYMCGLLLSKTRFEAGGDSIQKTKYTYTSDNSFNQDNYVATTSFTIHNLFRNVGSIYKLFYFRPGVASVTSSTKFGGLWVSDITTYNRSHTLLPVTNPQNHTDSVDIWNIESETIQRGNDQIRTEYTYPYTDTGINTQLVNQFCLPVTGVRHYLNNVLTDGTKTIYKNAGNIVPALDLAFASNINKCDTLMKYISYSPNYLVTETVDRNGINHKYYWNDHNQLIASAANGSINIANTNADINTIIANNQSNIFAGTPTDAKLYAYNNKGLPTKIVGTNGMSASFEYDNMGRLTKTKDTNGSTTNKYTYNYGKTISSTINELTNCSLVVNIGPSKNMNIRYTIPYSASNAEIRISRIGMSGTLFSYVIPPNITTGEINKDLGSGIFHIVLFVDGVQKKYVNKDIPSYY